MVSFNFALKSRTIPQSPWIRYCKCLYLSFVNYCEQFHAFYTILLSCLCTCIMTNNQKFWSMLEKEGSLEDFHLVCNVSVLSTGLIWLYLWVESSDKVLDAYYTIMAISLVHFGVILLIQLKKPLSRRSTRSMVRLVSNPRFRIDEKPILTFLKNDNTGMFVFTSVMVDSKISWCKIGLLAYYAMLNLIETSSPKLRKHPFITGANFGLGILESVVLAIFWYESFKSLQINKAICYTLMYLLRLEESGPTNRSVKGLISMTKFCYRKFNRSKVTNQGPQTAEIRSLSLGFDCYSIISDVK